MANRLNNRKGGVTLIMVMLTTMIAFIFAFENYLSAMHEMAIARNEYETERAFYASQSCVEEGFLHLKTDAVAPSGSITTEGVTCEYIISHDAAAPNAGTMLGKGTFNDKQRNVETTYADAGPAVVRNATSILHILDKSGSMDDDGNGCTLPGFDIQALCVANAGVWGPQPLTSAKEAAKSFVDHLDPVYDRIGAISYNEVFTQVSPLSVDYPSVKTAISGIAIQNLYTNIGDAIQFSTDRLLTEPAARTRVEILLTDGQANRPEPEASAPAYAIQKATEAKNSGILIFTIGLGNDVNPDMLQAIASEIDGKIMYFFAPDGSSLQEIYDEIAETLTSYNISQNRWQER